MLETGKMFFVAEVAGDGQEKSDDPQVEVESHVGVVLGSPQSFSRGRMHLPVQ